MVGCGYCVKTVHGRPYLYFWHYESKGGHREQVEEYVGPAGSSRVREEVTRKVAAYAERARDEMMRFVKATRAKMSAAT